MGKKRLTLDEIKSKCYKHGWILLSDEYQNRKTMLTVQCFNGHTSTKSLEKIEAGRGCISCRGESQRADFNKIKDKFSEIGLTILEDSYKDAHTPLPVVCNKGHYSHKTWQSVRKGCGCNECGYDNIRGEKNWNYNENLTYEDRQKRDNSEYLIWRDSVYRKDGFRCICCSSNTNIHAHHINSYHSHPELRTDVDNGVTLCKTCHYNFHKEFGFKNNDEEQLKMFVAKESIDKKSEVENYVY